MRKNKTKLNCGKGTVRIHGDLTEPAMDSNPWNCTETAQTEERTLSADDQVEADKQK